MQHRSFAAAVAATLILLAGWAMPAPAQTQATIDTSGVSAVRLSGAASILRLQAAAGGAYRASASARADGWLSGWIPSSWYYGDCASAAGMRLEGETLILETQDGSDDCAVTFTIDVPPQVDLSIDQTASDISLSGAFGAVRLNGEAARLSFDGRAATIDMTVRAMRAELAFDDNGSAPAATRIAADDLDLTARYPRGADLHYDIRAIAALVDSDIADTPGAAATLTVEARRVHARLR
ncbi:hypothetical protein [Aureimonas frigidaquae]|uniref:hypothetical protein n=1 Tax=Aureimonas frigidaquae TaxID=424757 RepID=UPI0007829A22|nr:hypothetical protein [Aureimonas frigidaquae]